MKKILLLILICFSTFAYSQTATIAKHKSDKIFSYFDKHIVIRGKDTVTVTDSLVSMLYKDMWFNELTTSEQHVKLFRIYYYESKTIGKYKKNKRYLHTWDTRIFSTDIKKNNGIN